MTDPVHNIADLEDAFFGGGQDEQYDALRAFQRAGVGADDLLEVVPAVVAIATLLSVLEVVSPEDAANMIGRLPAELIEEAEAWAYFGLEPWDPGNEPSNLAELEAGDDEQVGVIRDFFRRIFSSGPYSGGTPGKSVLNGVGAPDAGVGVNGDFYIDTLTWEIYGPKALNTWPSGVALQGDQGDPGASGQWDTAQDTQTETADYTLVTADAGELILVDSALDEDVTVDGSLDLSVGQRIDLLRLGAGEVTVVASSPATVNATPGLKLRAQYSAATLLCVAADSYVLLGDLKA